MQDSFLQKLLSAQTIQTIPYPASPASPSRWSWSRKRSPPAALHGSLSASLTGETKKPIIAKDPSFVLSWHFWTVLPCFATTVLLSLNFFELVIGTEIGKTTQETESILGVLQVAAKAHEITIMTSLVNIIQQWIQGYLIGGGTLLGLLGAEQSLGNISFITSQEFMAAVSYGLFGLYHRERQGQALKERRRRKRVLILATSMFFACLLCAVVGPASAVLMIPQLHWFFESHQDYDVTAQLKSETNVRYPVCYPYILIDPRLGGGQYLANPFNSAPQPQYWSHAWFLKVFDDKFHTDEIHHFSEDGVPATVNTTTTWGRPLTVGSKWKGGTNFSAVNLWDVIATSTALAAYEPMSKNTNSKAMFVANLTGIEATTVCRRRHKQPCGNGSDWCYMAVSKDTDDGQLQSSRDLLLIVDHMPDKDMKMARPRFWMTEGLRTTRNSKFTDSIVFVFEEDFESMLTVCSTSTVLKSVTASSASKYYSPEQAQLHDYLAYFDGNSTKYVPPRTLLYHENWLDQIHEDVPDPANLSSFQQAGNVTYPSRTKLNATENKYLRSWAIEILNSNTHTGSPIWEPAPSGGNEAAILETIIGGAYITILLRMQPSDSQYSTSYTPRLFIRSGAVESYPEDLIPEAMLDYTSYKYPPIEIYRLVYGYRSLSTIGTLSMVILVTHSVIALLGSLWQYQKGGVIRAWTTIPQYGALCLGTSPMLGAVENTCAGIDTRETLKTFVRIGETTEDHLELAVISSSLLPAGVKKIDLNKNYGFLGHGKRRKEKLD